MINLDDLMSLFTDADMQRVVLCDLRDGGAENIYDGLYQDIPGKWINLRVCSIDNVYDLPEHHGKIVINVDTGE